MSVINIPALIKGRHIWDKLQMPASEFAGRREKMCGIMKQKGLDGVICYADSICNGYVEYFTNYNCVITWSNAMLILLADGSAQLIAAVPGRDMERIKSTFIPPEIQVELVGLSLVANDHVGAKTVEFLKAGGLTGKKWGGINLSWCMNQSLADIEGFAPDIVDVTGEFEELRSVKTHAEISVISEAASFARLAAIEMGRLCTAGTNEAAAAADISAFIRCCGAEEVQILVGTSESGGYLRYPEDRVFSEGETVKIYVQVQYLRYKGEYGMTVVAGDTAPKIGETEAKYAEKFNHVLEGLRSGAEYAGVWGKDFHVEERTFSAIHGMGEDLFEMPCERYPAPALRENMVIGIVLESNKDCALYADTVLVGKGTCLSLSGQVLGF